MNKDKDKSEKLGMDELDEVSAGKNNFVFPAEMPKIESIKTTIMEERGWHTAVDYGIPSWKLPVKQHELEEPKKRYGKEKNDNGKTK